MNINFSSFGKLSCVIAYPDSYKEGEKYPVILFLHGAGTRGTEIERVARNPYFNTVSKHEGFPFITVAPLCSELCWYDVFEDLKALVNELSAREFADADRIYVMGASIGGYATWQLGLSMPEKFAAIVPICGGGIYAFASRLKDLPVWAFHGALDNVVHVEESQKMVDAINKSGGDAKLTIYPEREHNAWSDTYSNPAVFKWLLSHKRGKANGADDGLGGSEIYG